jgi:hypothetical protein
LRDSEVGGSPTERPELRDVSKFKKPLGVHAYNRRLSR